VCAGVQEKLMQLYFPEDSKTFKRQEKIRRRKQRMGRRYGRNETLLPVSTTTTDIDDGDDVAYEPSTDGPRQTTTSAAAADIGQSSSAGQDGAGEVVVEKKTKRRRTVDPASLPDFVWKQLGIRRSSVVECTEFDPEDFSTDDEDGEEEEEDEDEDEDEAGDNAQPRPAEKPMTDFVLEQLGIKPDQGKK
jgi:hypothetical protein